MPRALQAFFCWVSAMMRYVPESTHIKALNAAKSIIHDMLSEVMIKMAVPPGMEAVVCPASHDHSHPVTGRQGHVSSAIYG